MKFYRFKTFTTSYYFPDLYKSQQFMYGLYSAYGGRLSKIYWLLFKKYKLVRLLTCIDEKDLPFDYQYIKAVDGKNSLMSFNMGSPGVEQKISILGQNLDNGMPFFAKFSQKERAIRLTINEIDIYKKLDNTGLTPKLIEEKIGDNFAYLKAEYIVGHRPVIKMLNDEIINLCIKLKDHHLTQTKKDGKGLIYALSHGDFCPWNILVSKDSYKLIDWELAEDRPLGYDLFTYICQVSALFEPQNKLLNAINDSLNYINRFFCMCGVDDYMPYLRAFTNEKVIYEQGKGEGVLYYKYLELQKIL